MTDLRKAAQEALNALLHVQPQVRGAVPQQDVEDAIDAIRAALAEPAEPVAWLDSDGFPWSTEGREMRSTPDTYTPLYTRPPCREWKSLTEQEIAKVLGFGEHTTVSTATTLFAVSRAIEAALKEKNT
jgi:hypothetical protein